MVQILSGSELSKVIKEEIKEEITSNLIAHGHSKPCLAVVLVGDDPASQIYVNSKIKACAYVGVESRALILDKLTTQNELNKQLEKLNKDKHVDGILLQLPLPKHLSSESALKCISPDKDVDGLTDVSLGKLVSGDESGFIPCTPQGVMSILERNGIDVCGKDVTIVGRSLLVGKPLALLLIKQNATVTVCHTKTKDIASHTKQADIVICAVCKEKFLTADMIKKGAVIVDVGINRNSEGKVCGDVDFEKVSEKASAITPVPGGIGPLTITHLLKNVLLAKKRKL